MNIAIHSTPVEMGMNAGAHAARSVRRSLATRGNANLILATGTSQFETLAQLVREPDIDWDRVTLFHLDEYIGLPETHPASFRKYLKERFIERLPTLRMAHLINGESDPIKECKRLKEIISLHPIDLALVGIGENGHLAFNDPPADFETMEPYLIVELDDDCVRQQYGEGWFPTLADVPRRAISMSIKQIMKSAEIICSVPDARKAQAVKNCLENDVSNLFPASILQQHLDCTVYLDRASASLLKSK